MTGLSILALLAGLACIPVLDPDSRDWLRERWGRATQHTCDFGDHCCQVFCRGPRRPAIRGGGYRSGSGPPLHERMFPPPGSRGYRPKASALPRSTPPGPSPIPRKLGGYTAKRKVNPATVRAPSGPSAVTPPARSALGTIEILRLLADAKDGLDAAPPRKAVMARLADGSMVPRTPAAKPVSGKRRM